MFTIDSKTKEMFHDLNVRRKTETPGGTAWPLVKAQCVAEKRDAPYWFRRLYMQQDYRETVNNYSRDAYYSDCYRCLAYMIYGYGYMSNNERRMAGLKPRRARRRL